MDDAGRPCGGKLDKTPHDTVLELGRVGICAASRGIAGFLVHHFVVVGAENVCVIVNDHTKVQLGYCCVYTQLHLDRVGCACYGSGCDEQFYWVVGCGP